MKFYGQFDPPVDQFIFERYFPDKNIQGVSVECGAFDGLIESSCKFFEESMGWKVYNIEPVPWIFESLCKNRPHSQNLNFGLSDINSNVSFNQAISPILGRDFGNGSIGHAPTHLKSLEESGCTFEEINIKVVTWREFVIRQGITHVDLLVLDVEGHELAVIAGMRGCDVLPNVICVEFGHIGLGVIRDCLAVLDYLYDITSNGNAYFVQNNVIGLFALRRAATSPIHQKHTQIAPREPFLEEENQTLQRRLDELTGIYKELTGIYTNIVHSKGWRAIEALRSVKTRLFKK